MSYPCVLLGDYIDILSGFAFKSKNFSADGIPVIKIKNIVPPYVTLEDLSYVPNEIAESNQKYLLAYNDVLIALTGSHINQMASVVGRIARVKYSTPSLLNQRVGKITVRNENLCNLDYIYYFLSQDHIKIALASKAGGAANQANISPSDIKQLSIPLPSIQTQRRIADILSAYDDLIENNRKQIKLLEEAAQRLYKEWFVDLRFPGHEHTKIVDGVPEGWSMGILDDIVKETGESTKKENKQEYAYYLPIDCLPQKSIGYIDTNDIKLAKSSLVSFDKGDIIFGAMRPYFHKVVVARDKGITRSTCFVLNSRSASMWGYVAMLLFNTVTVEYATQISVGTTMPYVRWKDMKLMPSLIPNKQIAISFDNLVKPMIEKVGLLANQIRALAQARDCLLPKLMSGEVEMQL